MFTDNHFVAFIIGGTFLYWFHYFTGFSLLTMVMIIAVFVYGIEPVLIMLVIIFVIKTCAT